MYIKYALQTHSRMQVFEEFISTLILSTLILTINLKFKNYNAGKLIQGNATICSKTLVA